MFAVTSNPIIGLVAYSYSDYNITSSLIQVVLEKTFWKLLGNSDLNFPTSDPWLLGCKYVSIIGSHIVHDFTLLLSGI